MKTVWNFFVWLFGAIFSTIWQAFTPAKPAPTTPVVAGTAADPAGTVPNSAPAPPGWSLGSWLFGIVRAIVWAITAAIGWVVGHTGRNSGSYVLLFFIVLFGLVGVRFTWDQFHHARVVDVPVSISTPLAVPNVKLPQAVALNCAAGGALLQAIAAFEVGHRAKIMAFQRSKGLAPDGVIGPRTFNAFVGG